MTLKRGALIVIEGVDRTGKSTQCRALVENLKRKHNINAEYTNFPSRNTEIGKVVNSYLMSKSDLPDEAIHLLFSANRWERASTILQALEQGINIIVDRYCYSGVAFSAAKGLDLNWCKMPDAGLPKPDQVFFLTMPVESIQKRHGFGDERYLSLLVEDRSIRYPNCVQSTAHEVYEVLHFQKKVSETYMQLKDDSWEVLDASRSIQTIEEELLLKSLKVIESVQGKPIGKVWVDS